MSGFRDNQMKLVLLRLVMLRPRLMVGVFWAPVVYSHFSVSHSADHVSVNVFFCASATESVSDNNKDLKI